jgi:hypothetical protein
MFLINLSCNVNLEGSPFPLLTSEIAKAKMNPQQFHSQQFYGGSGGNSCNNPGYMHVAGQYATVGPMQRPNLAATPTIHTWVPPVPQEQQYYDLLFSIADEEKRNAIGGKIAVAFFTKSNVDKLKLREVSVYTTNDD